MKTYFAYGSNLCLPRFLSRVPSARFITVAKLSGWSVVFHKKSKDGSGKATLVHETGRTVYGALYEFADDDLEKLDKVELGYEKMNPAPRVITLEGEREAITYVAPATVCDDSLVPFDWYLDLIRMGARKLGLPESYITQFDIQPSNKDPDVANAQKERGFLR